MAATAAMPVLSRAAAVAAQPTGPAPTATARCTMVMTYQARWLRLRLLPPATRQGHAAAHAAAAAAAAAAVEFTAAPMSGVAPSYGGSCTMCFGSHSLPCTEEAISAMQELMNTICQHQRLDYDSTNPPDPRFALDYLFTLGPGRMLGVLLAVDTLGQQHVLKAFSGQITESWHIPGWVGPVAGIINKSPAYVKTRRVIEGMSARMHKLDQQQQQQQLASRAAPQSQPQPPYPFKQQQLKQRCQQQQQGALTFQQQQRQLLKRRRRCLSHHLLQQIQHSYTTSAVSGQPLSLLDVYMSYRDNCDPSVPVTRVGQGFIGMPAGVGDCCAPKLLHAAAQQGLTPVSMCEVWFGSAPGTATPAKQGRVVSSNGLDPGSSRLHCRLYGPCEKCATILGTMLCGLPAQAL